MKQIIFTSRWERMISEQLLLIVDRLDVGETAGVKNWGTLTRAKTLRQSLARQLGQSISETAKLVVWSQSRVVSISGNGPRRKYTINWTWQDVRRQRLTEGCLILILHHMESYVCAVYLGKWWKDCDDLDNGLLGISLSPGIHMDGSLTSAKYLNMPVDQGHLFMTMLFSNLHQPLRQDNAPCYKIR